jgi:putative endonuclease
MSGGWIYMMSDRYRGAIYTGATSSICHRAWQHRIGKGGEFTSKYGLTRLVYAEPHDTIDTAIARERAIKKWRRAWKIELIESVNPDWSDLFETLNM